MAETPLSKATVEAIFIKQGVPGWVGWGTYGAESSYGKAANSGHGFGLIEPSYGAAGTPNGNSRHNAEVSAKLYKELITQAGGIGAAVPVYSGNSYTIERVRQLGGASRTASGSAENLEEVGIGKTANEAAGAVSSAVKSVTSPVADIAKFVARLFEPEFWLRVGKGILGFLLLGFGALTLMKVLLGVDIPTGATKAAKLSAGFLA